MTPSKVHLNTASNELELQYATQAYQLSAEFLRVHSPSAEVKGHGGEGGELPHGKQQVKMILIEAVGNYALKISFDDGHNSGLYSWDTLHTFCLEQAELWQQYLDTLHQLNKTRAADTHVVQIQG